MVKIFKPFPNNLLLIYLQMVILLSGETEEKFMPEQETPSPGTAKISKSQFEILCGGFGRQPCTCYYPDHPEVAIFELSSDEITVNASRINGSGPSNCSDLRTIGYVLSGFYVVRFNNQRIKTIYCEFNQTNEYINKGSSKSSPSNNGKTPINPGFSQFCEGSGSPPCTALYSDYPDIPLFGFQINALSSHTLSKTEVKMPTNCEDLHAIGYILKGFYWVAINAKKVQLVYCDFSEIKGVGKETVMNQTFALPKTISETSTSSRDLYHCNEVGSQPCSCYSSKVSNLLQFELSNDENTKKASSENGTGPQSCEELKQIGYTFDGFYMIRFKTNVIKTIYCIFNYTESDEYIMQESTTQSTLKPRSTSLITTQFLTEIGCDKVSRLFHLNQTKCLNTTLRTTYFNEKMLTAVICDNSTESQQWVLRDGSYICTLKDKCLGVKSFVKMPYNILTIMSYNDALKFKQQWAINKTRQTIIHSQTGWRLSCLGAIDDDQVDVVHKDTKIGRDQLWSFEPILIKGVFKCANY